MVSGTFELRYVASYLDLLTDISNGDLVCSMSNKRHTIDFHIVNFSNLSEKIPTAPAYGT